MTITKGTPIVWQLPPHERDSVSAFMMSVKNLGKAPRTRYGVSRRAVYVGPIKSWKGKTFTVTTQHTYVSPSVACRTLSYQADDPTHPLAFGQHPLPRHHVRITTPKIEPFLTILDEWGTISEEQWNELGKNK